mmetsp:Transcript_11855/g.30466  ORF Transcript_11855/g.30466 Transcript_11855/m.30466 type:complete len:226 (+) Transcript_11855:1357-2034(+)
MIPRQGTRCTTSRCQTGLGRTSRSSRSGAIRSPALGASSTMATSTRRTPTPRLGSCKCFTRGCGGVGRTKWSTRTWADKAFSFPTVVTKRVGEAVSIVTITTLKTCSRSWMHQESGSLTPLSRSCTFIRTAPTARQGVRWSHRCFRPSFGSREARILRSRASRSPRRGPHFWSSTRCRRAATGRSTVAQASKSSTRATSPSQTARLTRSAATAFCSQTQPTTRSF